MKKETVFTLVTWTKRLLALIAAILWIILIFTISKSPAPFMEQAPYCMVSTMVLFGLLTVIYKGLDYWSLNSKI